MKRTVLGVVLLALVSASYLMAQNRGGKNDRDWRHADRRRHDSYRDYRGRRGDRSDIRHDQAAIRHDQWELRQDMRRGDYAAAQREREEMRWRYRDLHRDHRDVWRDTRNIHRDRNYDWARRLGWGWR